MKRRRPGGRFLLTFLTTLCLISALITFTQCTQDPDQNQDQDQDEVNIISVDPNDENDDEVGGGEDYKREQDVVNPISVEENDQDYKRDAPPNELPPTDNATKVDMAQEQEHDTLLSRQGQGNEASGASGASSSSSSKIKRGKYLNKKEFDAFWPPIGANGITLEESQAGVDEWAKYRQQEIEKYAEYLKEKKRLALELEEKYSKETGLKINITKDFDGRTYPFCVDGKLPFMDRWKYTGGGGGESIWRKNWFPLKDPGRDGSAYEPSCVDDECIDKDLERFIPLFEMQKGSQEPIISDKDGLAQFEHILDGADKGAYIEKIKFNRIYSPPPPLGISFNSGDASPELPFWLHIIVNTRFPLEGLFIQAIGSPMGLPFGNFRDDFHCDAEGSGGATKVYMMNPHREDGANNQWKWKNDVRYEDRATTTVPCKYSHGNNNGDMFPNVYAYGGKSSVPWTSRTEFRTHFMWSSTHCNMKIRVQFLVMAVVSFSNLDFDTFLTPNYILTLHNGAGSPPPYIPGRTSDFGWDESMKCTENAVITKKSKSPSRVTLEFDEATSKTQMPYNYDYDNCILHDETINSSSFFADNMKIYYKLNSTFEGSKKLAENFELSRKMAQICPPNDVCLNDKKGWQLTYDGDGHPKKGEAFLRRQFDQIKAVTFPGCKVKFCEDPEDTFPILKHTNVDMGPEEAKALEEGGTRFSSIFTRKFFRKGAHFMRKTRGTHVWCMTLAWFVLMTLGAFVGRYYKETAGINPETKNSLLGLGWWIWVHIGLFLLSLTFMWLGILETARFRQKPISCNILEHYGEYNLKNFCRWKKKIVRRHRKWGIGAGALYHVALLISWVRPVRNLRIPLINKRINLRKVFLVIHVLCAYIGKIVCVISIALFFDPRNLAICKSIPGLLIATEFVSIVFFAAGWVMQCFEDKALGRSRRVFPVPEAIESADSSKCYLFKIILVAASALIHLVLFIVIALIVKRIFGTHSKATEDRIGTVEYFNGWFGSKCNVISASTENESEMRFYYYKRYASAADEF